MDTRGVLYTFTDKMVIIILDLWIDVYDLPQALQEVHGQGQARETLLYTEQYKSLCVLMQSMLRFYKELNKKLNMHGFTMNPNNMFVPDQGIY